MLTIGSLFSGIGGLELGLEWAGLGPVVWQVEQDPFCQKVLERHWPGVERFDDVRTVGAELPRVDLICGGFPCQDVSFQGEGAGIDGPRSGLWGSFARIVRDLRPRFVVVENVRALRWRGLEKVLGDLARLGYDAEWDSLTACAMGAPHMRERVFIVAHAQGGDGPVGLGDGGPGKGSLQRGNNSASEGLGWLEPFPGVPGVSAGVPNRLDRLQALGNAVVPQCAEVIGWVIREIARHGPQVMEATAHERTTE